MSVPFLTLVLIGLLYFSKLTRKRSFISMSLPIVYLVLILLDLKELSSELIIISIFLFLPTFIYGQTKKNKQTKSNGMLTAFAFGMILLFSFLTKVRLGDSVNLIEGTGKTGVLFTGELEVLIISLLIVAIALYLELLVLKGKKWN